MAATVSAYWVNFARTGDPNGPGLPAWPAYGADVLLDLGQDGPVVVAGLASARLDTIDRLSGQTGEAGPT
jgi:hypothetical protein